VRRLLAIAAVALLLLAGAGVAFVLVKRHQSRDIRGSSTVEFVTTEVIPTIPPALKKIQWPTYGFDARRARAVQGLALRPPFKRTWVAGGRSLLEFPPVIGYGRLFYVNGGGTVSAVGAKTGKVAWRRRTGRCAASSPALDKGTVYVALLNRPPCNAKTVQSGEVIAFTTGFGRIRWRTKIGPTESSPLVANGLVYVGDWRKRMLALDQRTGRIRWAFRTGGLVKGGAALAGGTLYFGSYDSHVYAVNAKTGKLRWKASAQARFGHRGRFYSTPTVAYGRVYFGATDGKVYSFGASSGKLRWSQSTGGYVYASPAVWKRRVLIGSYSKKFYSLDAATGDVQWKFKANGKISGSPTVIDNIVYFSTFAGRTYALNAATGRQVWTFPDGKYSPVVADRERLYLVGYAKVYGMVEKR
jgi:outer membrane protein assembly factor BamB